MNLNIYARITFLFVIFLGIHGCGGGGGGSSTSTTTASKEKIYLSADDGVNGFELYVSDGTSGGTTLVKDINPSGSSNPIKLIEMNGYIYFCADSGTRTPSLWKTDGTTEGTVVVYSVSCGGSTNAVVIGDTFYFVGETTATGVELWKSDGTMEGTVLVKDINPGTGDSLAWGIVEMGGNLYFGASDNGNNFELWKSDGTADGTYLLKDINPGITNSSYPREWLVMGDMLYFVAFHDSYGYELWKTDGTTEGTNILKDINTNRFGCDNSPLGSNPEMLTRIGDKFYFTANDNPNNSCTLIFNGPQVWVSDGITTSKLIELAPPSTGGGSYPGNLTAVGDTLFFTGYTSTTGTEVWKSNGAVENTVMVKDLNPGAASGYGYDGYATLFSAVNDSLYFSGTDGTNGIELWKSDGSDINTVLVRDINTTSVNAGSNISRGSSNSTMFNPQYSVVGSTIYFTANDGIYGIELWKSDGSVKGTNLVSDINLGSFNGVDRIFK